ncbi:PA14 domain-containing protein [Hymenobacter sp. J193]|uniref:PA14 domain-containing protein n=1 Tax=Hymenobacter sp. J193 TaxID=2898429 RepID=UPI00215081E5|nr:PA14 domain-containing protein [Hymenobacter sp. J193]MCR5887422.1 PA14 domain-containing protein [Hymenobacter sp. J193]
MKHLFTWLILLLSAAPLLAQTSALPVGTGLKGTYYRGMNFEEKVFTRTDRQIDFDWEHIPPRPDMPTEEFSVRWQGWLLAPVTGEYEFSTVMDDGFRFWLGGKRLIDAWRDQDHLNATVRIRLQAGRYYPVRIEYFQNGIESRALLQWRRTEELGGFETVSSKVLFTALPGSARPIPVAQPRPVPVVAAAPKPTPAPVAAPTTPRRRPTPAARPATRPAVAAVPAARPAQAVVSAPTVAPAATPDSLPSLANLAKGAVVELKNLYFEQGRARLLPTSQPELNRLVRLLRTEAAARFEIAGHTDNVGDANLNQQLSEQRAQIVRRYLVQHGVDSLRLTAVGYGGTRPVADNGDPRQRPRNRRVELVAR